MSYSKVFSAALLGLECNVVMVETDCHTGPNAFYLVGLADKSIEESRERVKSAISNSSFIFPHNKVTVNLAPADLKKSGSLYDVPIALSILMASGMVKVDNEIIKESIFLGELGLEGSLRSVRGVLALVSALQEHGFKKVFIPFDNQYEASHIPDIEIYPVKNLLQLIRHLEGKTKIEKLNKSKFSTTPAIIGEFSYIKGQYTAKRALIIAASASHNLLFTGNPGSGKTMLAKSMQSLLPPLTLKESLEVTKIYSVSGLLNKNEGLITSRPFRSPHHSSSPTSIIGGGRYPAPGEVSLAHHGVLFLDEFPEFPRLLLENLRQPLEDKVVTVSRVSGTVCYPSNFMLLAAMNPCPCGYLFDNDHECTCSSNQINNYQKKISGPILDRIDLYVEVNRVASKELLDYTTNDEKSFFKAIEDIRKVRIIQNERFKNDNIFVNSQMSNKLINKYCVLDDSTKNFLETAVDKLKLSARAYNRILKLSRTIADLDNSDNIKLNHVSEALQYRKK